jgi:KUP system potassium uptake protein
VKTTNPRHAAASTSTLTLAALGVVYGDIGTSPLYAVKETFSPGHGIALVPENILGGESTIFWALMIVVSLKYVTLVLRADNRGEGGIMALLALATSSIRDRPRWTTALLLVGVFGASLFYGDAILTPAISVLSAVEGLEVGTSAFHAFVVPIALILLVLLFAIQKHGTQTVGRLFGPVCALWFIALAVSGTGEIIRHPVILAALDPRHALHFVTGHGIASFLVLGAVLLALTGAEAMYADMGHFGRRPIRIAWFGLVAPALVLNYFGQGALLIADPGAISNPFYLAFPAWALFPMIGLATAATIIASQATISGAYSMTQQAIQLGYLPRMNVQHTSEKTFGQIYVPAVNWILLFLVIAAVAGFGSSSRLASAYGVAVMGTMVATTFLAFFVVRYRWGYPLWVCLLATGLFMVIDLIFFAAAMHKVFEGGWFPLLFGSAVFTIMMTWRRGREILFRKLHESSVPLPDLLNSLFLGPPQRVPGTAVFLTASAELTPNALLHSLKHYKVLHERVVFMTVEFLDVPRVTDAERVRVEELHKDCFRVRAKYGFMEQPDAIRALDAARSKGLASELGDTSFFTSRETIVPVVGREGMALWRERLFAAMARNAGSISDYFNIPANRTVELGTRIEM